MRNDRTPAVDVDAPLDLWSEDADECWLRRDQAATASKARYVVWSGNGLPYGMGDNGFGPHLTELRVRAVYCRPGRDSESGWAGFGDATWWECGKDHPGAVPYWHVTEATQRPAPSSA